MVLSLRHSDARITMYAEFFREWIAMAIACGITRGAMQAELDKWFEWARGEKHLHSLR